MSLKGEIYVFIEKVLIPFLQWFMMIGIPLIIFGIGVFFLIKIFFLPPFKSGRKKVTQTVIARVLGKREEFMHNQTGLYSLYYVTFTFGENENIELMVSKSEYKSLSYMDKIELTHKGEKLIAYTVLEKSKEKTEGETKLVGDTMRSSLNELYQKKREN